jgi:hypothetical protein
MNGVVNGSREKKRLEAIDFGDEIGEKNEGIGDLSRGVKKKGNRLDGFPVDLGVLFVDHKKKKDGADIHPNNVGNLRKNNFGEVFEIADTRNV